MEDNTDFKHISPEEMVHIIADFKRVHKPLLSNYYSISADSNCEYLELDGSLLLRVQEHDYYRLYVITSAPSKLPAQLSILEDEKYVINIPSKKQIEDWDNLLVAGGFKSYAKFLRYYNTSVVSSCEQIGDFAEPKDAKAVFDMFVTNFDKRVDHIPTLLQLEQMIYNKQVLVVKDKFNELTGFFIFTIEGKKFYLNAWFEKTGKGLELINKAYDIMLSRGISYCYFWVDSKNRVVIKFHELMGAKKDGLIDYTYIN